MINKLDAMWERHYLNRRHDHGPMYVTMMIACFLTAVSMILLGPIPNSAISELSSLTQAILSWMLLVGAVLCLCGASIGSHFFFPRCSRRIAYQIAVIGIPLVVACMVFYSYAVMLNAGGFYASLGSSLGALLGLGAAINGVNFVLEIRRIERNLVTIHKMDSELEDE